MATESLIKAREQFDREANSVSIENDRLRNENAQLRNLLEDQRVARQEAEDMRKCSRLASEVVELANELRRRLGLADGFTAKMSAASIPAALADIKAKLEPLVKCVPNKID